jgi:hypothetical protein
MQLCAQSSRYFSSLFKTASDAFLQRSLGSLQPASAQSWEIKAQQSWASFRLKAMRLVRTSRHSSLARTHVFMYLKRLRTCCRSFWRLNSKLISGNLLREDYSYTRTFIVLELHITTTDSFTNTFTPNLRSGVCLKAILSMVF